MGSPSSFLSGTHSMPSTTYTQSPILRRKLTQKEVDLPKGAQPLSSACSGHPGSYPQIHPIPPILPIHRSMPLPMATAVTQKPLYHLVRKAPPRVTGVLCVLWPQDTSSSQFFVLCFPVTSHPHSHLLTACPRFFFF